MICAAQGCRTPVDSMPVDYTGAEPKRLCGPCLKSQEQRKSEEAVNRDIRNLVTIGFGVKKDYKPTVWKYATVMLDVACGKGYAAPYNNGHGKGKYTTHLTIEQVQDCMIPIPDAWEIAYKYRRYLERVSK
jgi:hypothetical protein